MLKTGDIIDIKIVKLGYCGEGVYKDKGIVLFVPRALPDDLVRVRINKIRKNYGSAELLKVINPSPNRVEPADALLLIRDVEAVNGLILITIHNFIGRVKLH